MAFGRVVHVYISDAVIRDGRVDPQLLAPVGRLGGSLYATVSTIHRMPRPSSHRPPAAHKRAPWASVYLRAAPGDPVG